MSVWLCIPSARPAEEAETVLRKWRERGYKIALWLDEGCSYFDAERLVLAGAYPGYAKAVNLLIGYLLAMTSAEWFVTGGDDVLPDPNHSAEEIARECNQHFYCLHYHVPVADGNSAGRYASQTFGVMQPTGDRWHEGVGGFSNAPIDRVCGSPWMGREFCRRINQGNGPLWPEYRHMYVDEELQAVAEKYGVLWQRQDLIHKHMHWGRGATDRQILNDPQIPKHLEKWNTTEHWQSAKAIFAQRKAAGFPGSEPIA